MFKELYQDSTKYMKEHQEELADLVITEIKSRGEIPTEELVEYLIETRKLYDRVIVKLLSEKAES